MATFEDLMKNPSSLTDAQILEMISLLEVEKSKRSKGADSLQSHDKPEAKEIVACPNCGCIGAVKFGLTATKKQRYKCKECGKTFTKTTQTIFSKSRLDESQWKEIVRGMVDRLSLQKIADNIGVSAKTVWYNKHKIQSTLQYIYGEQDTFVDIAECDECSVRLSFKGKRDPEFFIYKLGRMPRHNYSKTEKIEYLQKHGLWQGLQSNPDFLDTLLHDSPYLEGTNKDHVCVLSGKDRSGNLYIKPVTLGNIESRHVTKEFEGRFNSDAILVTDGSSAYNEFAEMNNIHHEQIDATKHSNGTFSLARINSVHSNLRDYWPKDGKNLPATKYVDLGLMFFWWQEKNKDLTQYQQVDELFASINNTILHAVTYNDLRYRPLQLDTKNLIPQYV